MATSKLGHSDGLCYNIKRVTNNYTWWSCNKRGCKSLVKQQGTTFEPGNHPHNHPPTTYVIEAMEIKAELKVNAVTDIFVPAAKLAKDIIQKKLHPCPGEPFLVRRTSLEQPIGSELRSDPKTQCLSTLTSRKTRYHQSFSEMI